MERERATRCAQRGLDARRFIATAFLLGAPLLLAACETLPGFGSPPPPPPVAAAPLPAVAPPPPRPRTHGSPALRFRIDPLTSGPSTSVAAAPMPPPASEPAPLPSRADVDSVASPPPPSPARATAPPLAGDSAATEVARAEPAATPPAPPVPASPIQPPPPSIDPASLRGATATELRDRFGAPSSQNPIASGAAWHYERTACKATFVLLPELNSGTLRVFSYEITPGEGAMFGPAGCLGRIAAARSGRNAGIAP